MKKKLTTREINKLIVGKHSHGDKDQEIANSVGVSKRTVERRLKAYRDGELEYCSVIGEVMADFTKQEDDNILNLLKSEGYANIVKMGLKSITQSRIDSELDIRGIGSVTRLIGTLVDKRLKSYAIDLERENLKLKNEIASNTRQIVFVGEESIVANNNKLQENNTKNIS